MIRNQFETPGSKGTVALISIALVFITLAVYIQVANHQFLTLDDNTYVTNNPHVASGITANNIIWAFTSVEASNWHPLTWLSHMADVQFYGMNPRGHHLTNVAIHVFSALLLLHLLLRLTGALWQSAFVAALFALHPLHVESVAWVAERKDLLSGLFWFLTLLFYAGYAAKRKISLYLLTIFSFMLGLMAKPMLVTLPIIMLLIDFWPLGRYQQETDIRQRHTGLITLLKEKTPFLACSLFSALITIYAQQKGGALSTLSATPLLLRLENALICYVAYLDKTVWPHDLAVLYPFPTTIPLWQAVSSLCVLLFLSTAVLMAGKRHPYLVLGWLWFLITMTPVIGIIQVGSQSMADRYTYIPVIGLFIMVAWGVSDITRNMRYRQVILALLAGITLSASAVLSWQQLGYWHDSISLYQRTLHVTSENYLIHINLGIALHDKGRVDEAIAEYRKALQINPDSMPAHYNLGITYQAKGQIVAAIQEYQEALRINPNHANTHNNLGTAFSMISDLDAATIEFREALRLCPGDTRARGNLEKNLARKRMQLETQK